MYAFLLATESSIFPGATSSETLSREAARRHDMAGALQARRPSRQARFWSIRQLRRRSGILSRLSSRTTTLV